MLLDEPSRSSNLRHQVDLLRTLQTLAREKQIGVLMASHDLNLAGAFADRTALVAQRIEVADGRRRRFWSRGCCCRVYGVGMSASTTAAGERRSWCSGVTLHLRKQFTKK